MGRPVRRGGSYLRSATMFLLLLLLSATLTPAIDDNLTRGATNNHVFEAGAWGENIDVLNGGLNLTIPIGPEYRVSGDLSFQLNLTYFSKFWHLDDIDGDGAFHDRHRPRLSGRGQAGLGFLLQVGRYYKHANRARCDGYESVFEDATGAAHPAPGGTGLPGMFADGSYMRMAADHIKMPDGTRYVIGHQVPDLRKEDAIPDEEDPLWQECPVLEFEEFDIDTNEYRGSYVTRIEGRDRAAVDPNQAVNYVEIEYETTPGMKHLMRRMTPYRNGQADPDRAIVFENSNADPTDPNRTLTMGYVKSVTMPVFSSDPATIRTATYRFDYMVADIRDPWWYDPTKEAYDNPGGRVFDVLLLTGITFPEGDSANSDGYRMSFEYAGPNEPEVEAHGYILARVLPTQARVEYGYEQYPIFRDIGSEAVGGTKVILLGVTEGIVRKHIVLPHAGAPSEIHTWRYERSRYAYKLPNPSRVVTTDPFGNDTISFFFAQPLDYCEYFEPQTPTCHNVIWNNGLQHRVEYYRGSSADLANRVRSEARTWEDDIFAEGQPDWRHTGDRKRIIETTTIYHDDGNKRARTRYEEFDGLGKFRRVTEFDSDDRPYRVRRVDYNCDVRDQGTDVCMGFKTVNCVDPTHSLYHCPLSREHLDNWILGTYSYSQVEDPNGAILQRSEFSYDDLGYLAARQDLLTIPTEQGFALQRGTPTAGFNPGDIGTEYLYEGDGGCPAGGSGYATGNVCLKTMSDHGNTEGIFRESYTYSNGAHLATRKIGEMTWLAENRVVDAATGLTIRSYDPSGVATGFTYDRLGRLTAVIPDSISGNEARATLTYRDIWTTELEQRLSETDYLFSRFRFDELGRLVRAEKRQADGTMAARATRYDIAGRVTYQSEWGEPDVMASADPNRGTTYDYTDPASNTTTHLVDPFGRVRRAISADGKVTRTDYIGLSSQVTVEGIQGYPDANLIAARTFYERDAFGQLTGVFSPRLGSGGPRQGADAHYSYDRLGRLTTVRLETENAEGARSSQVRSFSYDALGRQTAATNPENGTVTNLLFDAAGNVIERQDGAGNLMFFEYDEASRPTRQWLDLAGSSVTRPLAEQVYDLTGTTFGLGLGKLTTATSYNEEGLPLLREERRYNELNGRLSEQSWRIRGWNPNVVSITAQPELVMSLDYNGLGLVSSIAYPEQPGLGRDVARPQYTYANGFLVSVLDPLRGVLASSIEYNTAGGIERIVTRGNVETRIEPDMRNRPVSIRVTGPPLPSGGGGGGGGGGGVIIREQYVWSPSPQRLIGQANAPAELFASGTYAYDGAGNITAIGADRYWYDALNRLVRAEVNSSKIDTVTWSYDQLGNMTAQERITTTASGDVTATGEFVVDPATNQIKHYWVNRDAPLPDDPNHDVTYDANGNLKSDRNYNYIFDARSRLAEVQKKDGGLVARYTYDAGGYRFKKHDAATGMETFYLRGADGRTLSEFRRPSKPGALPIWSRDFIYGAGRHLVMIENETPSAPGGLRVTTSQPGGLPYVQLNWGQNPDLDLLRYRVHRSSGGTTETFDLEELFPEWYDGAVTEGQTYRYWLTAVDQAGSESEASETLEVTPGDMLDPAPPVPMPARAGDGQVELTWRVSPSPDAYGYLLYRRAAGGSQWQQLGGLLRTLRVTDLTVANGTDYEYQVRTQDTAGRPSSPVPDPPWQATPQDMTPPDVPQGMYAIPGANTVELDWRASLAPDVAGYKLYRQDADDPSGAWLQVGPTDSAPSRQDVNLQPNHQYRYSVSAIDSASPTPNESERSAPIMVWTKDDLLPAPGITALAWGYCYTNDITPQCFLPGNDPYPEDYLFTHENWRYSQLNVSSESSASVVAYRLYGRRSAAEPYELSREVPVLTDTIPPLDPNELFSYPIAKYVGQDPNLFTFQDNGFHPEDACDRSYYRASAVNSEGRESVMSAEVPLEAKQPVPENLRVLAEPVGSLACAGADRIDPKCYGLTLSWTGGGGTCGGAVAGYHVYRSRQGGAWPPIRITQRSVVGLPILRVDYLPLAGATAMVSGKGGIFLSKAFNGPMGNYNADPTDTFGDYEPREYAVRAVDLSGRESDFSQKVVAHTDASGGTAPCLDGVPEDPCPGPPRNHESYYRLTEPTADNVMPPGAPSNFSWIWGYGPDPNTNVGPPAGNWALVKWDLPAVTLTSGPPNEFRLMRQRGLDGNFYEVSLDLIPGDDAGIRQFLWSMPLDLACEDANYAIAAVDLVGRPAAPNQATSNVREVLKQKLRPENPGGAASNLTVTVTWDPLPTCGGDVKGYTLLRSRTSEATCEGSSAPANRSDYDTVGTVSVPGTGLPDTPGSPSVRWWYRVVANWYDWSVENESLMSAPVCIGADGRTSWRQMRDGEVAPGQRPQLITGDLDGGERREASRNLAAAHPRSDKRPGGLRSPHRSIGSVNPAVKLYFYHLDHLGTPRVITDIAGQPVSKHKYLPFGEELDPPVSLNTHKFTGHERDGETGLDYMLARYYGGSLGRFASFDGSRLGVDRRFPQSWNGYTYALNNPIRKIDPNGLYETNFHQGWTYFLAKQAGFSESEARTIAKADNDMDSGSTSPFRSAENRRDFHGFDADRDQARLAATGAQDLTTLGGRLHHFQDTFSHKDFGAGVGHWYTKKPDKTSTDPGKAVDAALQSFDILNKKAAEMGKQGFGAPDQDLLTAMANADANVKDYDPASKTLTLETSKDNALGLAKDLAAQGYKVSIDGVPYNY